MKKISKLHFITTTAALAEQACKGGVDWVQLRLKNVTYDEYKAVALDVQAVCKQYNATLIINDVPRLALDIGADGVHLGKTDVLTPEEEQELVQGGFIIGRTTNTLQDIIDLQGKTVHYIGLGPYQFTTTKQNLSPVLGVEGYKQILADLKANGITPPPVIAIGGILNYHVRTLLDVGVYGVAVSGAISNAADVAEKAKSFVTILGETNDINIWKPASKEDITGMIIGGIGEVLGSML